MRQDDRKYGLRVFSLTHQQTGVFARDSDDPRLDEGMTRPVKMLTFGKFYALDKAGREKLFVDRAKRKPGGGLPYYFHLEKHFDKYHWKKDDIDELAHNDPALTLPLPSPNDTDKDKEKKYQDKLEIYRIVQEQYVAGWRAHQASYFRVEPAKVWIGSGDGLPIQVDPEIGMKPGVSDRAVPWLLKLWFSGDAPDPRTVEACLYLLGEGRRLCGWDGLAQLGIWDFRHDKDPLSFGLGDNIRDLVDEAADEYQELRMRYTPPKPTSQLKMPLAIGDGKIDDMESCLSVE